MNLTEQWFKDIESAGDDFDSIFVTGEEFESTLASLIAPTGSPILAVEYQIILKEPFESVKFGLPLTDGIPDTRTFNQFDPYGSSCRISVWPRPDQPHDTTQIIEHLLRLIKSFWKPDLRDQYTRLISFQYPATREIADNSVARFLKNVGALSVLFCDLDKFKRVNDLHGQATGDRVILELSAIMQKTISLHAIPLHRSGDEFNIIYPVRHPEEVLSLARSVMQAITEHDFNLGDTEVQASAGIALSKDSDELTGYESLVQRAEKALKPGEEKKYRGRASFESGGRIELPANNGFSRNTAFCLTKSCLSFPRPFESPWLNMVSRHTCEFLRSGEAGLVNLRESIDTLVKWIQPQLNEDVMRTALPDVQRGDLSPIFSTFDLALAVAHGVFRAGLVFGGFETGNKTLEIHYDNESHKNCNLRLMPDDIILASFGIDETASAIWNLGGFVRPTTSAQDNLVDSRRALLIKIGHFDLQVPTSIFAEEIIVDDRPTRGGGLPDFWEATIARLITQVNENANIAAVYVMGRHEHGAQTISRLKELDSWGENVEQLSYKTGITSFQSILIAAERLKGKWSLPRSEEELVDNLASILIEPCDLQPIALPASLQVKRRFFERDLKIDSMALGVTDGCRTDSSAKAFPVVLEIARKFREEDLIVDQARQELRELIDFKVHLTNPTQDLVPEFYESERSSLEQYFKDQFLSNDGLFGRVFNGRQMDVVLNHLVNAIAKSKRQHSTRRAVLIVPPDIKEDDKDFTPLGLISVRIVPRFPLNRIVLHYSFTWRTVEALVGFPYSLYGSVRYSQHLTDELGKRLPEEFSRRLSMGEVSYIAHSLHIFMDEHGQNIARRIVEDATL